jgi:TonB family protein
VGVYSSQVEGGETMPLSFAGRLLTATLFLTPLLGQAPSAGPIDKATLFSVVRLCPSAKELIAGVQATGVDFRLSAADEQALLQAVHAGYRSPAGQPPLPDGPPLTLNAVVGFLQAHRGEAWVASLVEKRGVEFPMTLQGGRAILAAGGSQDLIGLIVLNQQEPVLSARAPGAAPPTVVHLTRDELARKLRRRVAPEYPPQARRLALYGSVTLEVQLGPLGDVKAFGKVTGHPVLVDAAKMAVRRWQWEPTVINRAPVEVAGEVVVEFVR